MGDRESLTAEQVDWMKIVCHWQIAGGNRLPRIDCGEPFVRINWLPSARLFFRGHGAMTRDLSFEIAQALPVQRAIEIDFGNGNASPFFCLGERFAIVAVNG